MLWKECITLLAFTPGKVSSGVVYGATPITNKKFKKGRSEGSRRGPSLQSYTFDFLFPALFIAKLKSNRCGCKPWNFPMLFWNKVGKSKRPVWKSPERKKERRREGVCSSIKVWLRILEKGSKGATVCKKYSVLHPFFGSGRMSPQAFLPKHGHQQLMFSYGEPGYSFFTIVSNSTFRKVVKTPKSESC